MTDYLVKEDVLGLLKDAQLKELRSGHEDVVDILEGVMKRVRQMYGVRPVMTGRWKTLGGNVVFCGGCGVKSQRMTRYCPNCGKQMINGVSA